MKFVITAGHGGIDPGAVANGYREADIATELRDIIASKLSAAGCIVLTDGKKEENLPLKDAIKLAKQGDIAIELHCNASDNPSARGVECISGVKNKQIAQNLANRIAGITGDRLRGDSGWIDQSQSQHSRLGYVVAGGIIVELFFISNPASMMAYQAKKWLVASSIVEELLKC